MHWVVFNLSNHLLLSLEQIVLLDSASLLLFRPHNSLMLMNSLSGLVYLELLPHFKLIVVLVALCLLQTLKVQFGQIFQLLQLLVLTLIQRVLQYLLLVVLGTSLLVTLTLVADPQLLILIFNWFYSQKGTMDVALVFALV